MAVGKPADSLLPEEAVLAGLLFLQVPQLRRVRIVHFCQLSRRVVFVAGHRPGVAGVGGGAARPVASDCICSMKKGLAPCRIEVSPLKISMTKLHYYIEEMIKPTVPPIFFVPPLKELHPSIFSLSLWCTLHYW